MSAPALRSTPDRTAGRSRRLLVLCIIAILLTVLIVALRSGYRDGPLEPDAPTPQGALAVVSVLDDLGTSTVPQRHAQDAADALRAGQTVLVSEPSRLNVDQQEALITALEEGTGRLVLIAPDFVTVSAFAPSLSPAGTAEPGTELSAGRAAGACPGGAEQVSVEGVAGLPERATLYRAGEDAPTGTLSCFVQGDGALLVQQGRLTVLGSASLLSNGGVGEAHNAAVALAVLGEDPELTWYIPSSTDPMSTLPPSILSHLPSWLLPVLGWTILLALAALLAVSWRLGPVVVEPLPVTVRAQELTIGRAHLMERHRTRDAAAESLRSAAAHRLASRLGMRRERRLDALVPALAAHTGRAETSLRGLLSTAPITTDTDLVRLAQDLDALEKEIDR